MSNPDRIFTVGGTVQPGRGVYVEREADRQLFDLCKAAEYTYVLTPRQMGKSSLMVRTALALQTEGIQTAIVDLSLIGTELSQNQWYVSFLDAIVDELDLDFDLFSWWDEHDRLSFTVRVNMFFREIVQQHLTEQLVVFIDEIDTTLSIDFAKDFYAAIRALYNERATHPALNRLSFVLIGVASPGDLINDSTRTPFNIGIRVDLTDFTEQEARPFAAGFNTTPDQAQNLLRWILKWTGGHPFLTQGLCQYIARNKPTNWHEQDVDRQVSELFFGKGITENHNLKFVQDMLTKRAPSSIYTQLVKTFRKAVQNPEGIKDREGSSVLSHLKLSGIVKKQDDRLIVRNKIYEHVFDEDWISKNAPIPFWEEYREKMVPYLIAATVILLSVLAFSGYRLLDFRGQVEAAADTLEIIRDNARRTGDSLSNAYAALNATNVQLEDAQLELSQAGSILDSLDRKRQADSIRFAENTENLRFERDNLLTQSETLKDDIEVRSMQLDSLTVSLQETADALEEQRQENTELDQAAQSIANAAKSKRFIEIGEIPEARTTALIAQGYLQLSEEETYLNEVLDALQLSEYSLNSSDGSPEASFLISPTSSKFEVKHITRRLDPFTVAYADNNNRILLWDSLTEPGRILNYAFKAPIRSLTFTDTDQLVVLTAKGHLLKWPTLDVDRPLASLIDSGDWPAHLLHVPDSDDYIYADGQAVIRVAPVFTDNPTAPITPSQEPIIACSGDTNPISGLTIAGSYLFATCSEGAISRWNLSELNDPAPTRSTNTTLFSAIHTIEPTRNEHQIAVGGDLEQNDYAIVLLDADHENWEALAPAPETVFRGHQGPVFSLSHGDRWLASGSADGTVRLWDMDNLDAAPSDRVNLIFKGHSRWVRNVEVDPNDNYLISGSADGTARLWKLNPKMLADELCAQLDTTEELTPNPCTN